MITTCTHCGNLYESGSEEQAYEPVRLCFTCRRSKKRQQVTQMDDLHQQLIRALIAGQVAVYEHWDELEFMADSPAMEDLMQHLQEAQRLATVLKATP